MNQHPDRCQDDLQIAQQRPAVQIFKIGDQPVRKVGFAVGRAAQAPDLRQPRQARLERVALPIALIDLPEQLVAGLRAKRMGARADDRHFPAQDVDQLGQLVDTATADPAANPGDALIVAAG